MAAAAILDFVTIFNLTKPARYALQELLGVQIWWKSVEQFRSYTTFYNFKMAAAAILDFVMKSQEIPTVILFYAVYFDFKFDENRLIGSKVTAVFQNIDFWLGFQHIGLFWGSF